MDWFSWLSKTGLEPSLIYEYGLDFSHNQLQLDDVRYLDHEFLQSMGISVAKHRLEILKLAKKETRFGHLKSLSRLSWALIRTKKCFSKYFNKLVFHEEVSFDGRGATRAKPPWYQEHWRGALLRKHKSYCEEVEDEKPMVVKTRSITLSGPLDGRVQERLMAHNNRSLKLSGPLDGKVHETLMYTNRSPRLTGSLVASSSPKLSGPLDGRTYEKIMTANKSPRLSGPLDGRVVSPKFCFPYEKEREDVDYDDHSLRTALFQDLKPT
ncbi:uncharacterized protein LOC103930783 [Pyrus x bretschneideri]|uniref:uncharacterized protein LOC103930783 n=1 Tax=Pyrus x bretschneideri TaxID=225117 RepID=UPI000510B4F3|nr:uncharacterized protein LOC103930783 [Pyrus x bretschneideri]